MDRDIIILRNGVELTPEEYAEGDSRKAAVAKISADAIASLATPTNEQIRAVKDAVLKAYILGGNVAMEMVERA